MPNLVVFVQKILIFTGEIKCFFTHITKNPPRHLLRIVFWSGMGPNGQKMPKASGSGNLASVVVGVPGAGLVPLQHSLAVH